ncbi:hypothetical protein [Aquamicrobium sp.]|uniref:hypothetical protein n=1 Tax=Aquamicrobium sp. TaxID=1872579 RepID=UPI0025839280|nr:hypothetical protein [Aquamicrobium sp.]MCK9553199.1 hypothetical protein [Aquamicrobium sp.]
MANLGTWIEKGVCPHCGCDAVDINNESFSKTGYSQENICRGCDKTFVCNFTMTSIMSDNDETYFVPSQKEEA